MEIDLHFVRDMVLLCELEIRYVSTTDQIPDALTKTLSITLFLKLKDKIHIEESPCTLRGVLESMMIAQLQRQRRTQ